MKIKTFVVVVLSVLTIATLEIKAQNVQQLGPNYFGAGIRSSNFNYIASKGRQQGQNWCWAACVAMVLQYNGIIVSQQEVVMRCYGNLVDRPGGDPQMFTALSGWGRNVYGGVSTIYSNNYPTNAAEIQIWLASNKPLIVGLNQPNSSIGHAYVLTAIYYSNQYDYNGNIVGIIPDKVVLRDPWPYNPSRQEISWSDFASRVNMCYKVWVN
ncbi:C39 family peptidase [uncultured Draconibacterium sp.]|uniref:C39 family peptidase n=1 Tax=uncultured Draconibacterium sp. TaxID=1573823 RepID=UPI002AA92D18|nr:papain-like cysteine protease family protein [uncultured Draconibacterium sp.]